MQYVYSESDAKKIKKHGIELTLYREGYKPVQVKRVCCVKGHFEEFYCKTTSFVYLIISGTGTFMLNGNPNPVKAGDLVVVPPKTRMYYMGNLEMVLTTCPAWRSEDEVHVRNVDAHKALSKTNRE